MICSNKAFIQTGTLPVVYLWWGTTVCILMVKQKGTWKPFLQVTVERKESRRQNLRRCIIGLKDTIIQMISLTTIYWILMVGDFTQCKEIILWIHWVIVLPFSAYQMLVPVQIAPRILAWRTYLTIYLGLALIVRRCFSWTQVSLSHCIQDSLVGGHWKSERTPLCRLCILKQLQVVDNFQVW